MLKSLTPASIKFKSLKGSLTNGEMSIPGYIYEETVRITFRSGSECHEVLEFILHLLNEVVGPVQKLKVLKMLKHVAERGDPTFVEMLSKRDRPIKEATGFSSQPDQVYGKSLCSSVRNEAQGLLSLIHSANRIAKPLMIGNEICGMGSSRLTSGKYDGFGSAQTVSTNVLDRVVSGISDLVDDMRKSGTVSEAEIESQLRKELQLDRGNYQPVKIPQMSTEAVINCPPAQKEMVAEKVQGKQRVVGRPGGGWDDDDFDVVKQVLGNLPMMPNLSEESGLRMKLDHLGDVDKNEVDVDEAELDFVKEVLMKEGPYTSWKELNGLINRLRVLNAETVMNLFGDELKAGTDSSIRILQLIEAVIHNDLLSLETLNSILKDPIVELTQSSSPNISCKAKKVSLIIERLLSRLQQDGDVTL